MTAADRTPSPPRRAAGIAARVLAYALSGFLIAELLIVVMISTGLAHGSWRFDRRGRLPNMQDRHFESTTCFWCSNLVLSNTQFESETIDPEYSALAPHDIESKTKSLLSQLRHRPRDDRRPYFWLCLSEYGWPFRHTYGVSLELDNLGYSKGQIVYRIQNFGWLNPRSAIETFNTRTVPVLQPGVRYIPARFWWPATIANATFWGGSLFALVFTFTSLRRFNRRRRGACLRCGYNLRGLPTSVGSLLCPECGARAHAQLQ